MTWSQEQQEGKRELYKNEWLADLLTRHRDQIVKYWLEYLRSRGGPHYAMLSDEQLCVELPPTVDSMIYASRTGDMEAPRRYAMQIVQKRMEQGFLISELDGALHALEIVVMRVVDEVGATLQEKLKALQSVSEIYYSAASIVDEVYDKLRSEQHARSAALYELGTALSRTLELESVLDVAVQKVAEAMQARSAAVVLAWETGRPSVRASRWVSPEFAAVLPNLLEARAIGAAGAMCPARCDPPCPVEDVRTYEPFSPWRDLLSEEGCLSMACVPLLTAGRMFGNLVVCMPEPHVFSEEEIDFLLALAGHVATAVQNARLFEEAKGKRELGLLLEASKLFASTLDVDTLLNHVARLAVEVTGADGAAVLLPDETGERLHIVSYYSRRGKAEEVIQRIVNIAEPAGVPVGTGAVGRAFTTGEPLVIDNYAEFPAAIKELIGLLGFVLAVPMRIGDRAIGVFSVVSMPTGASLRASLPVAAGLAELAAVAIENARLYGEVRRAAAEIQTMYSVATVLNSTLDLGEVLEILVHRMIEIAGVSRCSLFLLDPVTSTLKIRAAMGLRREEYELLEEYPIPINILSEAGRNALNTSESFLVPHPEYDTQTSLELYRVYNLQRGLLVPFVARGRLVGAALLDERGEKHEFAPAAIRLLKSIAGAAAISIENASLLTYERNIAETLQKSFLPPSMPVVPGYEFAARYKAALQEAEVGGDFYDVFMLDGNRVAVLIADVSGKGLAAAVYTAMGKYTIRAYSFEEPSPAKVMERFNTMLNRFAPAGLFITMFYGILDADRDELIYANAGHNQPFFYTRLHDYLTLLDVTGPGAGAFPNVKYGERRVTMRNGDMLFLYTDGATDVRRDGEMLGLDRLMSAFESRMRQPAGDAVEGLYRAVMDYSGGRLTDDVAFLALRKRI